MPPRVVKGGRQPGDNERPEAEDSNALALYRGRGGRLGRRTGPVSRLALLFRNGAAAVKAVPVAEEGYKAAFRPAGSGGGHRGVVTCDSTTLGFQYSRPCGRA